MLLSFSEREENMIFEEQKFLEEKLILFNNGKKYGQVVFLGGGAGCFDGTTEVETPTGYVPISSLSLGDEIYSFDEHTFEKMVDTVTNVMWYDNHPADILELTYPDGTTVVCTENHLFFVDAAWVPAKFLPNVTQKVVATRTVYDVSVETNSNFFVTRKNIPVHNSGKGFAINNFLEAEKFKIRDVDEWKLGLIKLDKIFSDKMSKQKGKSTKDLFKKYIIKDKDTQPILEKLKTGKMSLSDLDLSNPLHVRTLHVVVSATKIKSKTLTAMLKDAKEGRLPNIIFDITAKDVKSIEKVIPTLQKAGYEAKNISLVWVLTDYTVAVKNNADRERVVPDDILLDTHQGAAKTMVAMVNKKRLPNGMDGAFHVILNNRKNTVFMLNSKGEKMDGSRKSVVVDTTTGKTVKVFLDKKDAKKFIDGKSNLVIKPGEVIRPVVLDRKKGFTSIKMKDEGRPMNTDLKTKLLGWVKDNAPKTTDITKLLGK